MRLQAVLLAVAQIEAVALGVGYRDEVGGNSRAVVHVEFCAYFVPRRPPLGTIPFGQEFLHTGAVWLQHAPVAGFRPRRLRQPPYGIDGILNAHPAHGYPLRGGRQPGWVPPIEILRQVKPEFLAQHDEELEVIEVASGVALVPGSADVDYQAAAVLQNSMECLGERLEPVHVFVRIDVAIVLLAHQPERRAGHDQVDRVIRVGSKYVDTVAMNDLSHAGLPYRLSFQ